MTGTAGIILINDMLPGDIQFSYTSPVDSAEFKKKMKLFAKKYPEKYARTISKIANIGEHMAFYLGANVGPEDLKVNSKKTKALMLSLEKKMSNANTDEKKRNILLEGFSKAVKLTGDINEDTNEMAQQVKSGSRGKPAQFARMAIGPVYAVDMNQLPKTTLIKNNFTNGLNSQEYFNVSSQGRFSSVQAANATSEPGALGKVLIANTDDQIITEEDCGTSNGVFKKTDDRHIIGMFEAGTGVLIDESKFKSLKKGGTIKVRTPTTCQAKKGVCAKCYGLLPNGKLPSVGDNVGIIAAQTIGEVLTQMTLSTKHSTMGKKDDDNVAGVEGFKAIANSPSSFSGSSVIAKENGFVSRIEKAPQGGQYVFVGGKKYHIPPKSTVVVRQGQMLHKGDAISSGIVTPKQILENRSIGEAREHESNMLHKLFLDSTGKDLQKKHFDLVARGHLSLGMDTYGTVDNYSMLMDKYPRNFLMEQVSDGIMGKYLGEDVGSLSKGLEIDNRVMKRLKNWNVKRVKTTKERPPIKPIFKALDQRPSFSGSLFSKMNYRHLSKAIKDEILNVKRPSYINSYSSDRAKHTAGFL